MAIPKSPSGEMPFLDHLEELRWRIIYSLGALIAGVAAGFVIAWRFELLKVLQKPVLPYLGGQNLVYLHPAAPFSVLLQLAFVVGIAFALPVIIYQAWAFLSPALYRNERRVVIPLMIAGFLLFVAGASMAYFFALPVMLGFFATLGAESLTPMISVSEYFGFVAGLCVSFGLAFEVPIVLVGLNALGIVSARKLGSFRRYALVLAWITAAIITPGDMLTATIALAVPLYFLYEGSVAVAYIIEARRARRARRLGDSAEATA
jgi:sec-independent protein translocase protein TatC